MKKNSVVVFVAEDLDFEGLNCYDHHRGGQSAVIAAGNTAMGDHQTGRLLMPHIDQLAKEGLLFDNYYCVSAICTPSRYSMLTGRLPERSPEIAQKYAGRQATIWFDANLTRQESNIFKSFQENGYDTALFGKWHNFPEAEIDPSYPIYRACGEDSRWEDPGVAETLENGYRQAVEYLREGFGISHIDRLYANNPEPIRPAELSSHNIDWVVEGAVNYIRQRAHESSPFFAYVAVSIPHNRYFGYDEKCFNPLASPRGRLDKRPAAMPDRESIYQRIAAAGMEEDATEGLWLDDAVGAVVDALKEAGLYEDTCFVFTTDHPTCGKGTCNMGRIPFIVRWGQNCRSGVVSVPVSQADFASTILDIAGITPPDDMLLDGSSFRGLLDGSRPYTRESILMEVLNIRGIVHGQWKYIAASLPSPEDYTAEEREKVSWHLPYRNSYQGQLCPHWAVDSRFPSFREPEQLFNIQADPAEQENLIHRADFQKIAGQMREMLCQELSHLPHPFAVPGR